MTDISAPWHRNGLLVYGLQDNPSKDGPPLVNRFVALVQPSYPQPPQEELEAIADLMAAAPQLLKTVKALLWAIGADVTTYYPRLAAESAEAHRLIDEIENRRKA